MNADFTFDTRKFSEAMERIRQLGALTAEEAVSKASRIAVRQAILNTPYPRKGGARSLGIQKKEQEYRIKRDISKLFRTVSELGLTDEKTLTRIRRDIANGRHDKAIATLDAIGRKGVIGITFGPSEYAHKALRFKKRERRHYIMPDGSAGDRDSYIKSVHQRVFKMKAGWGNAAIGLKLKCPASLKRHFPGQGGFRFTPGEKPLAEFSNSAVGLGDTREPDLIMAHAMSSAEKRMAGELRQYLSAIGRGDFNGVRAKLQREKFVASTVE